MEKVIDAKGKKLGRVAAEAASILMGKNSTSFQRNVAPKVSVHVTNAGAIDFGEKKLLQKEYKRYSGYPGGLKTEKLSNRLARRGSKEVVRQAVSGMLPKNKLRAVMIKNLKVSE